MQREHERKEAKERLLQQQLQIQKDREMLRSAGIQTMLNFKGADQRKVVNGQFVLTSAEKEKLRI